MSMELQLKNKGGRKKGSKQRRNEAKYWLPKGIILAPNQTEYNKETKLIFIDPNYGEFKATFRAVQLANTSTHPEAVSKRRLETNIEKYGVENPSSLKEVREKVKNTNLQKYGVEYPNQSDVCKDKMRKTSFERFGYTNAAKSPEIQKKMKETTLTRYGVENAMQNISVQLKQFYTTVENGNMYETKPEKEINEWVQSLGFKTEKKFISDKEENKKQIDIYIPELRIGIEFNGLYWHSEANKKIDSNYHLRATNLCKKYDIRLIQIFEHEWKERKEQVKSFLKSALQKNEVVVYARKCEIKEIDKKEAKEFLEKYHIQGSPSFTKALGLYHNNELLCLASFGKHHRNGKDWVLSRFVGKMNYNVVGGLSRLVKHALDEFDQIGTWVDLRFSNGENWIKSGWEIQNILKPDYFYFDNKSGDVIPKQSRQKKVVNTPIEMTEHEHALSEKLYRIYDCGKLKLTIQKKY